MMFIRGTSQRFQELNPILSSDEVGIETDTNYLKAGNGSDDWANLNYLGLPMLEVGRVPSGLDDACQAGQIWWNSSGTQKTYRLTGFTEDETALAIWESIGVRSDIKELD